MAEQVGERGLSERRFFEVPLPGKDLAEGAVPTQFALLHRDGGEGGRHRLGVGAQVPQILGRHGRLVALLAQAGHRQALAALRRNDGSPKSRQILLGTDGLQPVLPTGVCLDRRRALGQKGASAGDKEVAAGQQAHSAFHLPEGVDGKSFAPHFTRTTGLWNEM